MLFSSAQVGASSDAIVISHVQAGAASGQTAAALQEFVVIYNNTAQDVDVTGWCLSNAAKPLLNFGCVVPDSTNQKLYLAAYSYMLIVSDYFSAQQSNYQADVIFPTTNNTSGSIAAGSDLIILKNAQGDVMDSVSWSTSAYSPSGGYILQRRMSDDLRTMIDTGDIANFAKIQGVVLPVSGLYEVVVDACGNIAGVQKAIPDGFLADQNGNCFKDACPNLSGLQATIPEEYVYDSEGKCTFDYVALQITELLPNVAGSDIGREFIELYNPTNRVAYLINYSLKIGDKSYTFPSALAIEPGQYMAFYNSEMLFTLMNTSGSAVLLGDDGSVISETDMYVSPKDDMAWAVIDGAWQFTNRATFSSVNLTSLYADTDDEENEAAGYQPCAANQYRHPDTQRCRLLVTTTAAVTACKDGQYRSEETNRCRTIALAGGTLTPCREQQYRSEETNRCRNIVTTASILNPCKDNQYRSEETNRCRTIPSASVPAAAFAVEPVADTDKTFVGWWILAGLGVLAFVYGAWEWRREVLFGLSSVWSFFTRR